MRAGREHLSGRGLARPSTHQSASRKPAYALPIVTAVKATVFTLADMTAGDWDLFEDWCAAVGRVALPTTWETVQAFLEDTQAAPSVVVRRLGSIRTRHDHARRELLGGPPRQPVPTPWRMPDDLVDETDPDGPRWLGLGEALHQLPVYGWPHAVTARRDAVVLALAERGWSRRQVVTLRPSQISLEPVPAVNGVDLPMTNHGLTCPSCALTRWMRVLSATYDQADGAWEPVATVVEEQPADVRLHDCAIPVRTGWGRAPWVLPSVDGHGRIDIGSQLPVRRVSAIVATRQQPEEPSDGPQLASASESHSSRPVPTFSERAATLHAIDDVLDDLDEAIDATDQRWEAIMARLGDSTVITDCDRGPAQD